MACFRTLAGTWRPTTSGAGRRRAPCGLFVCLTVVAAFLVSACTRQIAPIRHTGLAGAYVIPDPTVGRVTAYLVILSGEAANIGPEGLAHYVEHLTVLNSLFLDHSNFERDSNASTTNLITEYHIQGSAGDLPTMMQTLTKVFQPFTRPDKIMRDERKIIAREYDYRIKENPLARISEQINRRLFGSDPRGRSVMGKLQDIHSFTLAEARAFHARVYRLGNAVLIIEGNVTEKKAGPIVQAAFPAGDVPARLEPLKFLPQPQTRDVRKLSVARLAAPVLVYVKLVTLDSPVDIATLDMQAGLVDDVLDTPLPGGIAGPLRFDAFLAQSYDLGVEVVDECHLVMRFTARPDQGVTLDRLMKAFEASVAKTAKSGVPGGTFNHIKQSDLDSFLESDDPADFALDDALFMAALHHRPRSRAKMISTLRKTGKARIDALLRALAGPGRVAAILATPSDNKE